MSLAPGTRLGAFEIISAIGAGGMGEVYRARDTRLDRDVAIKILPAAFAHDPDRVARFEREAKAVAALSHPNILAIFDIGQDASSLYVVTELLEGESLRQWLAGTGQVSARQAIDIVIQTARGLAAAHDKSIVHRDLKPENVFLTRDGQVKILDFGLARQANQAQGSGATETAAVLTDPGIVMGTVGYMAPEQIRAQPVDARTDLFALGAVLYEMLTGRRAFAGDTAADTMIAIVKEDPPEVTRTRGDLPPALDRIVRRCLEKKPEQRFQSARDLAFALDTLTTSSGATSTPSAPVTAPVIPERRRRLPWFIAAAALLLLVGIETVRMLRPADTPEWSGTLLGGPEIALDPHLSPDGSKLAFEAMVDNLTQVAVMDPASGVWTILTTDRSKGGVWSLAWSPDSSRIYFARNFAAVSAGVYSVSALGGGDERQILPNARQPLPLSDGTILVGIRTPGRATDSVARYSQKTGQLDRIGGEMVPLLGFAVSKDEREFAFAGWLDEKSTDKTPQLIVGNLETGKLSAILPLPTQFTYIAGSQRNGEWLTVQKSGDLFRVVAVSDDGQVRTLTTVGKPVFGMSEGPDGSLYVTQVVRPQEVVRFGVTGGVPEKLAYSERVVRDEGGTLMLTDGRILLAGEFSGRSRIAAVQKDGRQFPFVDNPDESYVPLAPIGDQEIACGLGDDDEHHRIVIVSAKTGQLVRSLNGTKGKAINSIAGSHDGKTLFFAHDGSIWSIPVTDGEPKKLGPGVSVAPMMDGRTLIVQTLDQTGAHLVRMPVAGGVAEQIALTLGNSSLWGLPLAPNAVAANGQIVFALDSPDSWFEVPAVIDPTTGRVTRIPLTFSGDIHGPGWTSDGRILATGLPTQSSIWRFRREK